MKRIKYFIVTMVVLLITVSFGSCTGDLNTSPLDPNVTSSDATFSDTSLPYVEFLAKIYAGLATGGIKGAEADVDISGYDGGSQAGYLRPLWNLQELPTDEAICCWDDETIKNFHLFQWTASDVFINGFYSRLYYQITIATSFLQETTDAKLSARGCSSSLIDSIHAFRGEARFLRAMAYYNVLDLFRNGPMITDDSKLGTTDLPPYATSQEIFNYIVSELTDCQSSMLTPVVGFGTTYGHANKAAAWSLLARLYLNADSYLGTSGTTSYYTSCITYCNKVIAAGYSLELTYQNLFLTDNYKSTEIIFPIVYDGASLTTYGGMMFLECASVNSTIQSITNAHASWGGNRATQQFLYRFTNSETNYDLDDRYAMLYQGYSHPSVDDNTDFTQGTQVLKYREYDSNGTKLTTSFANTDFPVFRLADIYLMYAEAVLRGGSGGSSTTALGDINALRTRAEKTSIDSGFYDGSEMQINSTQLNTAFILEERARELFWEGTRRTDLVRYGKLVSSDYLWQWKGGLKAGQGVDSHYNYYPLPSTELAANPNLIQNVGY
jgi:starch-binding outer membrane protein, SusD/RagB family